jgi:hypothetical protein
VSKNTRQMCWVWKAGSYLQDAEIQRMHKFSAHHDKTPGFAYNRTEWQVLLKYTRVPLFWHLSYLVLYTLLCRNYVSQR